MNELPFRLYEARLLRQLSMPSFYNDQASPNVIGLDSPLGTIRRVFIEMQKK